ncbi:BolA family protein [Buchnera aphidicola]|uniref:BolA family protein n=1 Tax=Buchnera aphidicola TaxID=9 RepID=UPI00094D6B1D
MKKIIYKKIKSKINIFYLKIYDDNQRHILKNNSINHFRLIIVSKNFNNLSLIYRHKKIYSILSQYIPNKIYSLQIFPYDIQEWIKIPKKINRAIQCSRKNL